MRKLLRVIWVPLLVEVFHNGLYNMLRARATAAGVVEHTDLASVLLTIGVLLYLGWRAAGSYREHPKLVASGLGLLLWFCSTVLLTGTLNLVEMLRGGSAEAGGPLAGPLVAFGLFAPAALVVPVLSVLVRTRLQRGTS
jgi:hypothetical protein